MQRRQDGLVPTGELDGPPQARRRETSGSETGTILSETNGHYDRHLAMIFPSRSQLASKRITQTLRSGAIAEEGLAATLLQHVSPIEWDNVILYGQYVLDRARVR